MIKIIDKNTKKIYEIAKQYLEFYLSLNVFEIYIEEEICKEEDKSKNEKKTKKTRKVSRK